MDQRKIASLQKNLLSWYRKHARDLPWRRTKDPYKIWVSEIMLQQTQVDTVIPYYQKWIRRFPTLKSSARAPLSQVMKHWAGLGYYRRARMLHQAAGFVERECGGRIPESILALMKLPGIGRYTAGAIASIAFGQKAPILDGNVIRILTRIYAVKKNVSRPATIKKLWAISEKLVPENAPGDFNQGMMELGATVCLPDLPACTKCPVTVLCRAHQLGKETRFPVKKIGEGLQKIRNVALVLRDREGKVLLQKQPKEGRWGGLWMFPFWKDKKTMLTQIQLDHRQLQKLTVIKHGFTKYAVTLEVYENKKGAGNLSMPAPSSNIRWLNTDRLSEYALPSPHQKIANHLIRSHNIQTNPQLLP
ncbi:MAG: A/G-specific adenine glycosylase [Candidatus Omnitrophota bacterium]